MQDTQQQSDATSNAGGQAPAERQCQYIRSNGQTCRDWALRGHKHCCRHDRYLQPVPSQPIDVPLLEDEESIVLLLSETLRAVAWGTLPVSNGRVILNGCRLAHSLHAQRLETAKFRFKLRRLGIPEHEVFDAPDASPEPGSRCSVPATADPDPTPEPITTPTPASVPQHRGRFRDLKKNWDKELQRSEDEMHDMYLKRSDETQEDFKTARATPFDNLAAEERELQQVLAEAAALAQQMESEAATVHP